MTSTENNEDEKVVDKACQTEAQEEAGQGDTKVALRFRSSKTIARSLSSINRHSRAED